MTTRSVGNQRLLKLAALLRTLPPGRFYYGTWVGNDWQGAPDLSCGTTACALGWATTIPSLRRLGLRLKRTRNDHDRSVVALGQSRMEPLNVAQRIFALTRNEAAYLFIPRVFEGNASASEVAAKITRFVAEGFVAEGLE